MTATEPEPVEQHDETTGEEGGLNERAARFILTLVAGLAMWGIVAVFPEIAYVIVGILLCRGWDKIHAWKAGRQTKTAPEDEAPPVDVAEALRGLVGDDNGVLLTRLRDDLKLPDTKAVKRLLDVDGITWKAVRTRHGNGPGVHVKDIPAAPSPVAADSHGDGCCCRSADNNNGDNASIERAEEGIRVTRTDGGYLIYSNPQNGRAEDLVKRFLAEADKGRQ